MPNEFIARNGVIALNNSVITGSLSVSSAITASNITSNTTLNANGTSATFNTTNTYINSDNIVVGNNSTDVVGVAANTMYFPGTGNVGIGTTSPTQKLEVSGNIKLTSGGYLYGDGSSAYLQLTNANGSKLAYGASVYLEALAASVNIRATSEQIDRYNNNGRIYLSGSGNVGIGTTSPGSKLDVNGKIAAGSATETLNGISAINSSSAQATVYSYNYIPTGWSIYSAQGINYFSGSVGIGTTSPSAPLMFGKSVYGAPSSEDFYRIKFEDVGGINNDVGIGQPAAGAIGFNFVPSTGYIMFNEGTSNERMRIAAGGNVGIGTTTPNAKLDVNGNTLITGTLNVAPTAGNVELQVQSTGVNLGNSKSDLHNITGAIRMPYTSSGMIILDDPTSGSVYNNSDNFTQPQIRIMGTAGVTERTGISILKNQEVHLVSSAKSVFAIRTLSSVPRALLDSDTWLQWSPNTTDTFSPDTTIRRTGVGALSVTSSLTAASFTGSLLGTASFATSASWAPGGGGSAPTTVTLSRVTGSYTFVLADAGKTIEVSGSTNTTYNLTVPSSSTVNFPSGTFMDVTLYGTGSLLFTTASVNVTIRSANNWVKMGTRYGAATLIKISVDEWYLIGNLNA